MIKIGRKCSAIDCIRLVDTGEFCYMHYKRMQRHGTPDARTNAGGTARIPTATSHELYTVWRSMTRTNKGLSVCERWKKFENFVEDIGKKPANKLGLYRLDAKLMFEPGNVYWADFVNSAEHRAIRSKAVNAWIGKNPSYAANASMRAKYGVTLGWYNEQLAKQNGVCAICGNPETRQLNGKTKRLAVDHCHDTGKVRGLLCATCNTGIGNLKHSIALLEASIKYIQLSSST